MTVFTSLFSLVFRCFYQDVVPQSMVYNISEQLMARGHMLPLRVHPVAPGLFVHCIVYVYLLVYVNSAYLHACALLCCILKLVCTTLYNAGADKLAHGAVYSLCTIIISPVVVDTLSALLKGFYHYKTFMSIKSDQP